MKKFKLALITAIISASACFSALAGTWTDVDPEGNEYYYPLYFIKDDGTYACNEWVPYEGESYWIDADGMRPYYSGGVASDGVWYDSDGKKVDFKGKYLDHNDVMKLHKDMTYEQIVKLLGAPHSLDKREQYYYFSDAYNMIDAIWFSQDMESSLQIQFRDNKLYNIEYEAYFK